MEFVGHNGQINLLDDKLIISRKGFVAFLTNGLKGEKTIPFSSITAVQFKAANMWVNGYIQFSVQGGVEGRGGVFDATRDENSVMFRGGEQHERFSKLKEIVEERLSAVRPGSPERISVADELEKFANLRDRGIITNEEFNSQKQKILGI